MSLWFFRTQDKSSCGKVQDLRVLSCREVCCSSLLTDNDANLFSSQAQCYWVWDRWGSLSWSLVLLTTVGSSKYCLSYSRRWSECCTYFNPLNLCTPVSTMPLVSSCYRRRNWNTEWVSGLPKVTQLVSGRGGIWTQTHNWAAQPMLVTKSQDIFSKGLL